MNQFSSRFDLAISDTELDRRITVQPAPLDGLGKLDPMTAMDLLEKKLKLVFVPTMQIRALLREYIIVAKAYSDEMYGSIDGFVEQCLMRDISRRDSGVVILLTGLSGTGKTELIQKLGCLFNDAGKTTRIPGLPEYPIETVWFMAARAGASLAMLLKPLLPKDLPSKPSEVLITAAKRAYTFGTSLNVIDEFQFLTGTSNAHASASAAILGVSLVGPPVGIVANFSMVNKLAKRPHEERCRLLGRVRALHPDPVGSPCWAHTVSSQCAVAPELFASSEAFNPVTDAEPLHNYSLGIKRESAKLLCLGYGFAREAGHDHVRLSDIEKAYSSDQFKANRLDIERRKSILASANRKPSDLYCPLVADELPEIKKPVESANACPKSKQKSEGAISPAGNVTAAATAIAEYQSRLTDELIKSGLSPEDRMEYEKSLVSSVAEQSKGNVRSLPRPKASKTSLEDAFNRHSA